MLSITAFGLSPAGAETLVTLEKRSEIRQWTAVAHAAQPPVAIVTPSIIGSTVTFTDRARAATNQQRALQIPARGANRAQARLKLDRIRLRVGQSRGVLALATDAATLQAGPFRTRRGLRWATWSEPLRGPRRDLVVSPMPFPLGRWQDASLTVAWSQRQASLRVRGTPLPTASPATLGQPGRVFLVAGSGPPNNRLGAATLRVSRIAASDGGPIVRRKRATPAKPAGTKAPAPTPAPAPAATPAGLWTIPGREVARGDFENGFGQWSPQRVANDRIQIVSNPVAEGRYAARFEVRPGDMPICCTGDRAEVMLGGLRDREGDEGWYTWATMFDQTFPSDGQWFTVMQFHSTFEGTPPLWFTAHQNAFRLVATRRDGGGSILEHRTLWTTPIQRGRWYHVKMHVRWSASDTGGLVELWIDGQKVVNGARVRTLVGSTDNYPKLGFYRNPGENKTAIIYHDGFRATRP